MEDEEMNFGEMFLIAVGLSMDALAIALCKGLSVEKVQKKHMVITGLWFGGSHLERMKRKIENISDAHREKFCPP